MLKRKTGIEQPLKGFVRFTLIIHRAELGVLGCGTTQKNMGFIFGGEMLSDYRGDGCRIK